MEGTISERSLASVEASDLVRLAGIAAEVEAELFAAPVDGHEICPVMVTKSMPWPSQTAIG
jgi:hypothetical protein